MYNKLCSTPNKFVKYLKADKQVSFPYYRPKVTHAFTSREKSTIVQLGRDKQSLFGGQKK